MVGMQYIFLASRSSFLSFHYNCIYFLLFLEIDIGTLKFLVAHQNMHELSDLPLMHKI